MYQQLGILLFLMSVSGDKVLRFGYPNAPNALPVCMDRGFKEGFDGYIPEVKFNCEALSSIIAVKVRIKGLPERIRSLSGAHLEQDLGNRAVTVHVWGENKVSLDYEIHVYARHYFGKPYGYIA